jgi:hypothetical protein
MAGQVRVTIDRPGALCPASPGLTIAQRPPGLISGVGFGRRMELGLMVANAAIWTWVAALPVGLA